MSAKYACIAQHLGQYAITLMCRVLAVSTTGYYAAQHRPPSARRVRDEALRVAVRTAHAASRRRYGAPRVHAELQAQGEAVSRKRIARLMREDALVARPRRRFVVTTDAAHPWPIAPNTLARGFDVATIGTPDRVWAADITYLPTREGWAYLAVVLDLGSRRVLGWAMRATLERELALAALTMALRQRRSAVTPPVPALLHHSDRGSQYASAEYRTLLATHGLSASMSRRGNCYDNAVVESFFATVQHELGAEADWATRQEAEQAVAEFIEIWYNRQRRHSSLGYRSPVQYEEDTRTRGPVRRAA